MSIGYVEQDVLKTVHMRVFRPETERQFQAVGSAMLNEWDP